MQRKKKAPKWTRAVPLRRPDSIISSEFTNHPAPQALLDEKEELSMFKLLSFGYAQEWFKAKEKVKEVIVASNEAAFLQRRYVIRGLLKKKHEFFQPEKRFIMKRFRNVPSKIKAKIQKDLGIKEKETSEPDAAKRKEKEERDADRKRQKPLSECPDQSVSLKPSESYLDMREVCGKDEEHHKKDTACPIVLKQLKKGGKSVDATTVAVAVSMERVKEQPKLEQAREQPKLEQVREQPKLEQVREQPKLEKIKSPKKEDEKCVCTCTCACVSFRPEKNG